MPPRTASTRLGTRRRAPLRAFTLVELLVAVALGSIILIMIAQIFSGASQVFTVADNTTGAYNNTRIAMDLMEDQLQDIAPEWRTCTSNPPPKALVGIIGTSNTIQIKYYSPEYQLSAVEYSVSSDSELVWKFDHNPTVGSWAFSGDGTALLTNVSAFNVRYYDSVGGSWATAWDASKAYLPSAVSVEVTISGVQTRAEAEPEDVTFTRIMQVPMAPKG